MTSNSQIPDFVWKALLDLAKSLVVPAILALAVIGGIVLFAFFKMGKIPGFGKKPEHQKGHDTERRRHSDDILMKVLEQNSEAMQQFLTAYKENATNLSGMMLAVRAIAENVQDASRKQDSGFHDIHKRLDRMADRAA